MNRTQRDKKKIWKRECVCNWIFRGEEREIKADMVYEEIMILNCLKPMKDTKAQIQEFLLIPRRIRDKTIVSSYYMHI